MNITKSTTSFTCPDCGHTTSYELGIHELVEGQRLICGKCGKEIPLDRNAFAKVETVLEGLPFTTTIQSTVVAKGTVALRCPSCGTTSTSDMSLQEFSHKDKIFCTNCGKEIPVDREKLQKAENALDWLKTQAEGSGDETIQTPDGSVIVKKKSFNFNFKLGKSDDSGSAAPAGGTSGGTPIITARRSLEPKRGCMGILALLALSWLVLVVVIL